MSQKKYTNMEDDRTVSGKARRPTGLAQGEGDAHTACQVAYGQCTQDLVCHVKKFGFDPRGNEAKKNHDQTDSNTVG